jgi:LysR family transcriptional regulator, glycine cleavage system transcriptional activator
MNLSRLPLTALRSFEAAGRLLSFTKAADELFVSQAAVSRQVRELEERLGLPLFERHHRRVALTAQGSILLSCLTEQFTAMARVLVSLSQTFEKTPLFISVDPGFAACCIMPRINRFQALYPETEIVVDSDHQLVDFRTPGVDLAIRFGFSKTTWPGVEARHLVRSPLSPVVAPDLYGDPMALRNAIETGRVPLIHDDSREAWRLWLAAAGMDIALAERGYAYTDTTLVVQAALRGQGIALPGLAVVRDDIEAGRLVQPFDLEVGQCAYHIVSLSFERLRPQARVFCDWLSAEFGEQAGSPKNS